MKPATEPKLAHASEPEADRSPPQRLSRALVFFYGIACYALGVAALLYLICFVGNIVVVPKTIDSAPTGAVWPAVVIDLILVGLFALQHSVMARPGFKSWWTRIVPKPAERSTYVLLTSAVLALLLWQWRPIDGMVWQVDNLIGRGVLLGLFGLGWIITFAATFMINHFDLFGLRQVYLRLKNEPYRPVPFVQVALYRFIRHPIMLGILMGYWATPSMSAGHLLFAAASTGYIFIGIALEERDAREAFGASYERYHRNTPMLVPMPRRKS